MPLYRIFRCPSTLIAAWCVLLTLLLTTACFAAEEGIAASPAVDGAATQPAAPVARLLELQQLSAALIERAASGASAAHQYRIEARIYRELLRRVTLDNRVLPGRQQLPPQLLLEMVRMSALLHSAAECRTGMVITCPPDLMRRLRAQQERIDQEVTLYRMASD